MRNRLVGCLLLVGVVLLLGIMTHRALNRTDNTPRADLNTADTTETGRLYDRTYLEEKTVYTYRMSDPAIIEKYDELYAQAFADLIDSYERLMASRNGSSDSELPERWISDFELYCDDYSDMGYTYVDLDCDGSFELLLGDVRGEFKNLSGQGNFFEKAYALADGSVVKICETGGRDWYWLGSDGYVYKTSSGGAFYYGTYKLHFDGSELTAKDREILESNMGQIGFAAVEFLGCWGEPVHIVGPAADSEETMNEAAELPENRITNADWSELSEEWELRYVAIDWLTVADYMERHALPGA